MPRRSLRRGEIMSALGELAVAKRSRGEPGAVANDPVLTLTSLVGSKSVVNRLVYALTDPCRFGNLPLPVVGIGCKSIN